MGTSGESLNSGRQILMFFFNNQMVFLEHAAKVMLAGKIWWFSSRFFWTIIKTDGFRSDFLMCSLDFPWISIKSLADLAAFPNFPAVSPCFFRGQGTQVLSASLMLFSLLSIHGTPWAKSAWRRGDFTGAHTKLPEIRSLHSSKF